MKRILLVISLALLMSGCSIGKYEGKTAQEWADSYYAENTSRINLQNEYDSLQYEKDDLQNEYDDFVGCVEDYPYNTAYNCL
ncbi:MAG: membrane lipoprotein lipid attachment site-containing protein [Candidatus Gracilibacteria bacterium]